MADQTQTDSCSSIDALISSIANSGNEGKPIPQRQRSFVVPPSSAARAGNLKPKDKNSSTGTSPNPAANTNINGGRNSVSSRGVAAASPSQANANTTLESVLKMNPDLKIWLEITGYFNDNKRMRVFDKYQKVKAYEEAAAKVEAEMALKKAKIEEERVNLLREIESDFNSMNLPSMTSISGSGASAAAMASTASPSLMSGLALVESGSAATPSSAAPKPPPPPMTPPVPAVRAASATKKVDKRARSPADEQPKQRKQPRMERNTPPPASTKEKRRSVSPLRQGHGYRHSHSQDRQMPERGGRYGRYDSYRSERPALDNHHRGNRRHDDYSPPPLLSRDHHGRLNLGRPGDTRFFMVKSFSNDNVLACMDDGIWTTQNKNSDILTSAFEQCKNVVLFYSVNNSKAIQGYARMISPPSPNIPAPTWMKTLHWKTSHPFRVQWISRTETPFWRVGHLRNPLNEDMQVFVAKDGQEIPFDIACELVSVMDDVVSEFLGLPTTPDKRFDEPESPVRGRPREYNSKRGGGRPRSRSRPPAMNRAGTGTGHRGGWSTPNIKQEPNESSNTW